MGWIDTLLTSASTPVVGGLVAAAAPHLDGGGLGTFEVFIIAGLVFINGFFVAAEFALVKVRTSQIDQLVEQGNWAAKLTSRALDRLDAYLSASQVGITVTSLALGWAIEGWVVPGVRAALHLVGLTGGVLVIRGVSLGVVPVFAFTFVTFLHVALGEQAPKSLAIRSAKIVALWTAPPLMVIYHVFFPVIWLLNNASNLTLWMLGLGKPNPVELAHSEEELRHIVAESVAGGHLSRSERVMIENVLNLEEKTARRVMVPRPDVVYLSLSRSLEDNLRVARQAGHTRYPLCEDDLTTVVGMIHVKDLFRAGASGNGRLDLRKLSPRGAFFAGDAQPRPPPRRIPTQQSSPRDVARRIRQRGRHGQPGERVRGTGRPDSG